MVRHRQAGQVSRHAYLERGISDGCVSNRQLASHHMGRTSSSSLAIYEKLGTDHSLGDLRGRRSYGRRARVLESTEEHSTHRAGRRA